MIWVSLELTVGYVCLIDYRNQQESAFISYYMQLQLNFRISFLKGGMEVTEFWYNILRTKSVKIGFVKVGDHNFFYFTVLGCYPKADA